MKSLRRTALCILLIASLSVLLQPGTVHSQSAWNGPHHEHDRCGILTTGPGLPAGRTGFVDRFNYPWAPSRQLVEAQRDGRRLQSINCGGAFRIDFEDVLLGTRTGFDDRTPMTHPVLGATTVGALRQRTICEVFGYLAGIIQVNGSPDILIRASQTDGGGFLAAATPLFTTAPSAGFTGGTLYDHITTGADPTPAPGDYDAWITFDFGPWVIGGSPRPINSDWNQPAGGSIDLFSIALHEATHTLGFLSLIAPDGSSLIRGSYSLYDSQLRNGSGTPLIDPITWTFRATPGDLLSNAIVFTGDHCNTLSPVYSPAYFAPGSSLSHFDSYRSAIRYVMRWATSGGEDRVLTEQELEALCTMGYRMNGGICNGCAPVGLDDTASTLSGVEVCVDVLVNDYDPDGGVLTIHQDQATIVAGRGIVEVRNGRICFTPPADFTGPVYITYVPFNGTRTGRRTTLIVWVTKDRGAVTGLDSGLIAYWSFNDSTGTDNSGNGNHGNYISTPKGAPGVCGAGIFFDGVDDYIRIPTSPSLESLQQMTVSYWIKFYSLGEGPGTTGNTIGNGSDDQPWGFPGFFTYSSRSTIRHALGSTQDNALVDLHLDASVPLDQQEYYYVTFTVSEDTLKVYRNACLIEQTPRHGLPIVRKHDWLIAWSGDNSGDVAFLNGYMDEIRIHDRALSHEEILEYYAMCGGKRGLDVSPSQISFGVLECPRKDSTLAITVTNNTPDPIDMSSRLAGGREFTIVGDANGTIASRKSREIVMRFDPGRSGYFLDTLIVEGDCTGPRYVIVSGARESCGSEDGTFDLVLSKVVSDTIARVGDRITYSIDIGNSGPEEAHHVIAQDLVPRGVTVTAHSTAGPPANFNPATGLLAIPHLRPGESVRLTLICTVDSQAPDTVVNCVELMVVEGDDRNFANNRACATFVMERCPAVVPARIGREYRTQPGKAIHTPIELLQDLGFAKVLRVRIVLRYDSTLCTINNPYLLPDLLGGTLVEKWFVESITSRKGRYEITLRAPNNLTWLRGPGRLLNPELRVYLGSRAASDVEFQVDLLDQDCATIDPSPGQAGIDSICGLNYRLIELLPGAWKVGLEPGRPNPFGGTTDIRFHTGLDGHARLEVMDAGGKQVAVLLDADLPPGEHSVRWDAGELPSGRYYCRLDLGYVSFTREMLLVK